MRRVLKEFIERILRYFFWLEVDRVSLDWKEFWIEKDFREYLKFKKFARWHQLYDDNLSFGEQEKFIMTVILHDYFIHLGYIGVVETDNFGKKYLIWRYTL